METILITGGTGLIGRHLCKKLKEKGYDVAVLSRTIRHNSDVPAYFWDPGKNEIEKEAITKADYIIHLAGAGIGDKKWTGRRKKLIIDSRVRTGQLLFDKIQEYDHKLKAFISASGVGYYGTITSDRIFLEKDPPSVDFTGETCRQWEETAEKFEQSGTRTVKIRTGVVLAAEGGALPRMMAPVRLGIGSAVGTGRQFIPWIHIDDICNIYIKAIEDPRMKGAYNAAAPDFRSYRDFIVAAARILKKPLFAPDIPQFVMKIIFGEMSVILLEGSRVSSDKIRAAGFNFNFPDLKSALRDLIS